MGEGQPKKENNYIPEAYANCNFQGAKKHACGMIAICGINGTQHSERRIRQQPNEPNRENQCNVPFKSKPPLVEKEKKGFFIDRPEIQILPDKFLGDSLVVPINETKKNGQEKRPPEKESDYSQVPGEKIAV